MKSRDMIGVGLAGVLVASSITAVVATQATAVTPSPNPKVEEKCEMDFSLMLDASGSIKSANAVEDVRGAAQAFVDALNGSKSTVRLEQFATATSVLASRHVVDDTTLAPGGALAVGIADYYDPRPPVPTGTWEYDGGGDWRSPGNWSKKQETQWTNWDAGLEAMRKESKKPDLAIFVTDGDPTAFNLDQAGDPHGGAGSDHIGFNTDRGDAKSETLRRAIEEANKLKDDGVRVLVVGVGSGITSNSSKSRMKDISGPQLVQDADLDGIGTINEVDVAVVSDFAKLGGFLRSVVKTACNNDPDPTPEPTPEPTPTPTPTPTPKPETPVTVTPTGEKPQVGVFTPVLVVKTPGEVTVKVICNVDQVPVKGVCQTKVKQKGNRTTVYLKPTCNDKVTADIRVRAKEAGKTATVVGKSVKVAKRPFTTCKANANG